MADVELEADLSQTAFDEIEEHGTAVKFTWPAAGRVMNTTTGKFETNNQPTEKTVKAIIEDKGLWVSPEVGRIGEKKLTVAGLSITQAFVPGVIFELVDGKFTILDKGVKRYIYGDSVVIWEVYGVKGR